MRNYLRKKRICFLKRNIIVDLIHFINLRLKSLVNAKYFYLIEYYNSNYVTPKILQENSGFKDHRKKTRIMYMTVLSVMDWYIKDTGNVPPDYNSTQSDFQNDRQSDEKKNQSLYVCFNNNKFISPSESITEQDCLKMQYKVKVYIQLIKVSLIEPKEYYPLLAKALKKAKEKYGKSEEVRPVNPNIAKL